MYNNLNKKYSDSIKRYKCENFDFGIAYEEIDKEMYISNLVLLLVAFTPTSIVSADNILRYINEVAANQFEKFIQTYDKKYENELEKSMRFGIFLKNLDRIAFQNKVNSDAVFGINQFSDLIDEEFIQYHTGYIHLDHYGSCSTVSNVSDVKMEAQFDWRNRGVVTRVKNQFNCGACWAFSAIGNVESINAIKTNNLQELSEQQLVDCEKSSHGCRGGYPMNALSYLVEKGSMSESEYAYKDGDGDCRYNENSVVVRIQNCLKVSVSEEQLPQKLSELGPLSIVLDSTNVKSYSSGVMTGDNCRGDSLDHAVLIVGYGVDSSSGKNFWVINGVPNLGVPNGVNRDTSGLKEE